ncbi:helix-turn-helix domain-containing protein [Zhongshania aliphaticivorans]|uniref:AraC family transcriptional regulator n=1 Tax=Zhongshania aliphaticivorans TaxID=1470434 RepID=UPI0039C8DD34
MSGSLSTFWVYLQEILENAIPPESPVRNELNELIQSFAKNPIAEQHEQARRLFEIMAEVPLGHELAFQSGAQIPLTAYAPLAIPMKFAPTLADSLHFLARYVKLQAPLITCDFTQDEHFGYMTLDFRLPMSETTEIYVTAAAFSALSAELSLVTGSTHNFHGIRLRNGTNTYLTMYKKFFGVTPDINLSANTAVIPRKVLEAANPFADRASFKRYGEEYEQQLKDSRISGQLSEKISGILTSQISQPPNMQDLAVQLNISNRQLRFALTKEGTSYRELLMRCRVEYCRTQLRNPRMNISQLAQKLGYNDITAFNHGFKRWTGKSPTEFQRELLSK